MCLGHVGVCYWTILAIIWGGHHLDLLIHHPLNLLSHLQETRVVSSMIHPLNLLSHLQETWGQCGSLKVVKWNFFICEEDFLQYTHSHGVCHVFRFGSWKKLYQSIIQPSPTNFSKVELACGVVMFFLVKQNNKKSGWYWLFYILTTFYMKGHILTRPCVVWNFFCFKE